MRLNAATGRRRCSFSATPAFAEAFHLAIRSLKILVEPSIRASFLSAPQARHIRFLPSYPFAAAHDQTSRRAGWPPDPALTFNEGRPTWRRAVRTNSVEVPRDRRYFFIAATVGVAAAALLDVRASRQAQDRPLSADRRVEAILTTSARG